MHAFRSETRHRASSGTVVRAALRDALAVVLPVQCAGCSALDRVVCDRCRDVLACVSAPAPLRTPGGLPVLAGADYDGTVRACVLELKANGSHVVARALAPVLARALDAAVLSHGRPVVLGAVPSSPRAWRRRGFDPVRMLLASVIRPLPPPLLTGRGAARPRREQKQLDASARRENVAGTVRARRSLVGVDVLLIDDVITTGATLDEAARAVISAGGRPVGAAVLAATARRTSLFPELA